MIDHSVISRILCVMLVAAVMMPLGHTVYPYLSDVLSGTQFHVLEAVLSATGGFGIYAIFG